MELRWTNCHEEVDWFELAELYRLAPLGEREPKDLLQAFSNSKYMCFVFHESKLIGVGRALADGVDCSYICDIAVHPNFQGSGLGKKIVDELVQRSVGHKKIMLYSVPGLERFYEKLGFKRMCTAMAIFQDEKAAIQRGLVVAT